MAQIEPKKVGLKIATLATCGLAAGLIAMAADPRESASEPPYPTVSSSSTSTTNTLKTPKLETPSTKALPSAGKTADSRLDRTPPRRINGLVLEKASMNWTYNCTECQATYEVPTAKRLIDQPLSLFE